MKGLNLAEWAIKHKPVVYFFIFFILLGGFSFPSLRRIRLMHLPAVSI